MESFATIVCLGVIVGVSLFATIPTVNLCCHWTGDETKYVNIRITSAIVARFTFVRAVLGQHSVLVVERMTLGRPMVNGNVICVTEN